MEIPLQTVVLLATLNDRSALPDYVLEAQRDIGGGAEKRASSDTWAPKSSAEAFIFAVEHAYFGTGDGALAKQAAALYGIEADIEAVMPAVQELRTRCEKTASAETVHTVSLRGQVAYPIKVASDVSTASEYFTKNRFRYTPAERGVIAEHIYSVAEKLASLSDVGDAVYADARRGIPFSASAAFEIRMRAGRMRDTKVAQAVLGIADAIEVGNVGHEQLKEACDVLNEVDDTLGLVSAYGGAVRPPEDILFGCTDGMIAKMAADALDFGNEVHSATRVLEEVGAATCTGIFGPVNTAAELKVAFDKASQSKRELLRQVCRA